MTTTDPTSPRAVRSGSDALRTRTELKRAYDLILRASNVGAGARDAANDAIGLATQAERILDALLRDGGASPQLDLVSHLHRQRAFSERTFGPGTRTAGVVDHLRKELREIESKPHDLSEWIDVVILGFDGAWRAGFTPEEIVVALVAKQTKNEGRQWPDWRTAAPDKAIEHVRGDGGASPAEGLDAETEQLLREYLWLSHGHQGVYGDDGEMQCSECAPYWDYKRMPLADAIRQCIHGRREVNVAALASKGRTSPTEGLKHHSACDPGWGPWNYRCHPDCPMKAGEGRASVPVPERLEIVHKILHEFTGRKCRNDGGWCDARDHAEAILTVLPPLPDAERVALATRLEEATQTYAFAPWVIEMMLEAARRLKGEG